MNKFKTFMEDMALGVAGMLVVAAAVLFIGNQMSKSYAAPPETSPSCDIYRNTKLRDLPARCARQYMSPEIQVVAPR